MNSEAPRTSRERRRTVVDRLGSFWRRDGWYVLAAAGVLAVVLGYLGWTAYDADVGADWSWSTRLYLTLQLFTINSGGVEGPIPLSLDIARFLAPFVLATAAVGAVISAVQRGSARVRARAMRGHVIVAGLGDKGLRLASDLRARGRDVVAIERDPGQSNVAVALHRGIPVLIDDASTPASLGAARMERASHLIAVAGRSENNAAIAAAATAVQSDPSAHVHDRFQSFIEITDLSVARELQAADTGRRARLGQEFFNLDDRAARALLDRLEIVRSVPDGPDRQPTLAVVGLGQLGGSVVVEAARRWDGVRRGADVDEVQRLPLRVIALIPFDDDADHRYATLQTWYPKLARHDDLETSSDAAAIVEVVPFDANETRAVADELHAQLHGELAPVVLTLEDEALQLRAAIALAHAADDSARIIVTAAQSGGITELISDLPRVEVFATADEVCSDDQITNGRLEGMARSIHEAYYRHVDRTSSTADKQANPAFRPWDHLTEDLRRQNFEAAESTWEALEAEGYRVVPHTDRLADSFEFPPLVLDRLAEREHLRWFRRKHPDQEDPTWADVDPVDVGISRAQVREIPRMLAYAGLQLVEVG